MSSLADLCLMPTFYQRTYSQYFIIKLLCQNFVTTNALSFAFAGTSLHDEKIRALAYGVLERFLKRLSELSDESFPEKLPLAYIIRVFKDSVTQRNQRISHIISHFFARVSHLVLTPSNPLYNPIMTFFSLRPSIPLDTVPEFLKLFFSSSTEHNKKERQFILRLCSEAIIDSYDYQIFAKIYGPESCMAIFASSLVDYWTKLIILKIFKRCANLYEAARDLFIRINFASWTAMTIQHEKTTLFEQFELIDTLMKVFEQMEASFLTESELEKNKTAEFAARKHFNEVLLQQNANKILMHLTNNSRFADIEEKEANRRKALMEQLNHFVAGK